MQFPTFCHVTVTCDYTTSLVLPRDPSLSSRRGINKPLPLSQYEQFGARSWHLTSPHQGVSLSPLLHRRLRNRNLYREVHEAWSLVCGSIVQITGQALGGRVGSDQTTIQRSYVCLMLMKTFAATWKTKYGRYATFFWH